MSQSDPSPSLSALTQEIETYMRESMAMPDSYTDQEQNWLLGHMVTFVQQHVQTLTERLARVTAEKVVAQHSRALELMSRGSAVVELENKLREQLALAEIKAEDAESQVQALTEERARLREALTAAERIGREEQQ